ncbi:DNA-directed DNA polymerase eta rad30 [Coelomomyces lativittatus]|nr:DNA-directed DNA polymerase eta rad30 [Coelomomyces lativittatus]
MSTLSNHQLLAECSEIRCICHIDLDCFYCQVEHKRLGIPASVPLAVQQWQGLIAVNYAARAANVKRHESIHEALKKCPELRLVHVATYSDVDVNPDYHPDPSPLTHKVSLEPYRRASADIFKIISRFSPKYQKASVDEDKFVNAYLESA